MARSSPVNTTMPYWVRRRIFQRELGLTDFSGGLNLRDAPSELANNETPDCWNVTLNERGGVEKRLGYAKKNVSPYTTSSAPQNEYVWLGTRITQCGADLFKNDGTMSVKTFSTAARAGFAEFGSSVYAIHPVDGIFASTDAATWAHVAGSPAGTCLEPWQNRLLAGGDPSNGPRLYASAIGDATDWTVGTGHGWYNDIREHDSQPIVAIKSASGIDIAGKPGVIVCKGQSSYRVNDSNTGSYQTISTTVGAASAISVVNLFDQTFILSPTGVYHTNGVNALTLASGKLQPLFTPTGVAFDQAALFCAGRKGDRVHFSLPRAGSTANDLHLEYHPAMGWIVAGSDAMSCYATDTTNGEKLYGGSPTVHGQVYELGVGGNDDGAAITCRYQTKWIAPEGGIECRFRRLRVFSRGSFSLYVKRNFDVGQGDQSSVLSQTTGMVWGTGVWGTDVWGPGNYEASQDFWSLGTGTYVSFVFSETSTMTSTAPQLLDTGTAPTIGAFAVYGLGLQFIPLSL